MLKIELDQLREKTLRFLLSRDYPCSSQEIARQLFGARYHEDPVAHLVVRTLCREQPGIIRAHDANWMPLDASYLDIPLQKTRFIVVDLETTGSLIGVDRIIEIGVAVLEGGKIVQQFSSLVSTRRRLSHHILKLTGIKNADLHDAPHFPEVAPMIMDLLQGAHAFVGHDVRFDFSFLRWELARHDLTMPRLTGVCTLKLSQYLWPDMDGWRLQDLATHFAVPHSNPHRAGEDALATAGVLSHAIAAAKDHQAQTLGDLIALTSDSAASVWTRKDKRRKHAAG